jgi:hypothetical protein
MRKSHRRTSSLKSLSKNIVSSSKKALPVVNNGLQRVGTVAKGLAEQSIPIVEKGASVVYGTMAKGFDLGIKGARGISKSISKKRKSKQYKKHRKHTRRN